MIMNGKNLCAVCLKQIPDGQNVCEECRHTGVERIEGALPLETVLKGRYIVGKCLYYDNSYYFYTAYDTAKDESVFVRELFPKGDSCKRTDKKLAVDLASGNEKNELKTIFQNFYTSVHTAQSFNDCAFGLKIREMFEENNTLYAVSEYPSDAVLLSEEIRKNGGTLSVSQANSVVESTIKALMEIHLSGAVHGNIRPENIILCGGRIRLTGYHHGAFACVDYSSEQAISRSNNFAPIEQIMSNKTIGPQADIYSLGVVWYYMLTGKLLAPAILRASNDTVADADIDESLLSAGVAKIIRRMTAVNARDRFADIYELIAELETEGIVKIKPIIRRSANEKGAKKAVSGKKKLTVAAIAIVLCAVIAVLLYFFVFKSDDVQIQPEPDAGTETTDSTTSETENGESEAKTAVQISPDAWKKNVMKGWQRDETEKSVFGSTKYNKADITSVEFCDSLDKMGADAWDVSEAKNKSVMAWVVGKKLFVGAKGGVNGKASAKALFYNYTNLTEIKFGTAYHTDNAQDMSSMFENCFLLKKIEFSDSFRTDKVIGMAHMFDSCRKLESLDLSMFDTKNVMDMTDMFWDCRTLTGLNLSNFDTSKVVSMNEMFKKCSSLKRLDISGFSTSPATTMNGMFEECIYLSDLVVKDKKIKEEYSKVKLPLLFNKDEL
ncbi:MAG: BspA family leucine-rich repeat surface protein [Clostridia bacterium]|nr:BspA family leucine-rich repeat surface protein [Clostridia bacterium]